MASDKRAVKPSKTSQGYYTLALHPEIAKLVVGRYFIAELTEDGILYRPVPEAVKPKWLEESNEMRLLP